MKTQKSHHRKGVSMPLVIGLVTLLMVASVAVNQIIIRTLRASHNVEAQDRAYFAAEAGIEDALYQLTPHFAGYETAPGINSLSADPDIKWENDWEISSHTLENYQPGGCPADSDLCGRLRPSQKLVISLYNDNDGTINTISGLTNTTINFKIPANIISTAPAGSFGDGLQIDNDGDLGNSNSSGPTAAQGFTGSPIIGLNEDGDMDDGACNILGGTGQGITSADADCDGREDEDSIDDTVIFWKIVDDKGYSLTPINGCLSDDEGAGSARHSEICEKDFDPLSLSLSLNDQTPGLNQNNQIMTIGDFLNPANRGNNPDAKLQMEFLIVAPLEQSYLDGALPKKFSFPYLEYEFSSDANGFPNPVFTIRSEGWYQDFKQTIITNVTPKTTAPLIDFTIVQQQ